MVKAKIDPTDHAELNRLFLRHFGAVMSRLTNYRGQPSGEIAALNPNAKRRFREFRLLDQLTGRWANLETGDQGDDLIEAVAWLADVPRSTAAAFLAGILGEIIEG